MDSIKIEYESKNDETQIHLKNLENIIIKSNVPFEGNCFYYDQTLNIFPELYSKQLNLFWCGKQAIENICEIGFNAGHSTMLMLLGRTTPINFTIFDIGHHLYTKPSFEYIKSKFSYVNFEYVEGDSTIIMPEWINNNPELQYGAQLEGAFDNQFPNNVPATAPPVDLNKDNVTNYNAKDYLPKEINDKWFDTDFSQAKINVNDDQLIVTDKYVIGINTVGQSLKNASYDIRGTVANPKFTISPWNNSTYEPDYNLKSLC
jgi:hypothetical protein